jgi:selenide,water dikinase
VKRLLLIGAGHAHLAALKSLAQKALYGARVTVVTPWPEQIYSGMLPGLIAGHYRLEEVLVDVRGLAARAHAELVMGSVQALDLAAKVARLSDSTEIGFDVVSLNIGSAIDRSIPGSAVRSLALKPYEGFVSELNDKKVARVAVAGSGAAGMEIGMALRHRGAEVTLYSGPQTLSPEIGRRLLPVLRRMGVDYRPGMPVESIEPGPVVLSGPSSQEFDLVLLATGAVPFEWPRRAGLQPDERGFVLVDPMLRSVSHPYVFAVGDCATLRDAAQPRSGVYSVRQGEVLAENLRRDVTDQPLARYRPRKGALSILSCGGRYAIAERGGWSAQGRWVWRWKDWIDRRWLRSLNAG